MRDRLQVIAVSIVVVMFLFVMAGCSKQSGPSDADVSKVIQSAIEGNPKGITLKSSIVIMERGKQLPSGDWPVKVEYTIGMKDGSTKKEVITYNLSPSIDAMGANIWLATEAK